jgi:phosphoribosylanthranilate isomerase
MTLRYVSLTGADNAVDVSILEDVAAQYHLFECAILMFPEREGMARNPTKSWREKFYQSTVKNRALHLCGSAINLLAQEEIQLMREINQFKRVQINLKLQYATVELVQQLVKVVNKNPHIEFITQHNEVNTNYFPFWNEVENHSYLYDGSLGKGVTPEKWLPPVPKKNTGYAGGLNPDNVVKNLQDILRLSGDKSIWIDMETGIRTADQFDLEKVLSVLEQVNEVVEK